MPWQLAPKINYNILCDCEIYLLTIMWVEGLGGLSQKARKMPNGCVLSPT